MATVLAKPCRHGRITSKEENEIREIFYRHWETMKNQMKTSIDVINTWRSRSIGEIDRYADEQIRILKRDYDRQRGIFDRRREENLETAKIYHNSKESNLFDELSAACRSLQFQVAQISYSLNQTESPRVITVGERAGSMKHDNTNTHALELGNGRNSVITDNSNSTVRNGGDIARSSPNSIPSNSNEIQEQSVTTASSNFSDWPASNGNNSGGRIRNNDDWNDKCPICFMIFPLNMIDADRHQHVNEHMVDDHHPDGVLV